MSCSNYNNCRNKEVDNMAFPTDKDSLYAQKIYDQQTAASRCYSNQPRSVNIIEGFGDNLTLTNIIKYGIIILVLILVLSLIYDNFFAYKMEVSIMEGGKFSAEYYNLTPIDLGDGHMI